MCLPDVKNVAGSGYGLVYGFAVSSVPRRVVEHVEVRRRSEKGFMGSVETLSFWFVFFNDDPLRVAGEWVDSELELGAHCSC